jgi:two-component system chemotaxis sensor kinase CheA
MLGVPPASDASTRGHRTCVVIEDAGNRAALELDALLGTREVVVEQLEAPLVHLKFVSAAGLLGTGQIVPILRPSDLVRAAVRTAPVADVPVDADPRSHRAVVLVVDDSITTRTMEKSLLEAVGYQVRVAADGLEAWSILKTEPIDLVVSDVDMPRLDGFELTARIRAERSFADLPVVLVTVLESREDKERGIAVGANAYMVKSSFDQSNLLEIIHRLV